MSSCLDAIAKRDDLGMSVLLQLQEGDGSLQRSDPPGQIVWARPR